MDKKHMLQRSTSLKTFVSDLNRWDTRAWLAAIEIAGEGQCSDQYR
jgi:hypothetical protein